MARGVYAGRFLTIYEGEARFRSTDIALQNPNLIYDVPEKPVEISGPDAVPFLEKVLSCRVRDSRRGTGSLRHRVGYADALDEAIVEQVVLGGVLGVVRQGGYFGAAVAEAVGGELAPGVFDVEEACAMRWEIDSACTVSETPLSLMMQCLVVVVEG